jgi:hypothetical protein
MIAHPGMARQREDGSEGVSQRSKQGRHNAVDSGPADLGAPGRRSKRVGISDPRREASVNHRHLLDAAVNGAQGRRDVDGRFDTEDDLRCTGREEHEDRGHHAATTMTTTPRLR